MTRSTQPPHLATRVLIASFLTVALVLTSVFALFSLYVQRQTRESVRTTLEAAQQTFARVEGRRQDEMRATVATLAENPTLKAALDTWQTERRSAGQAAAGLVDTVERELGKLATRVNADVLGVVDATGEVVASAGRHAAAWRRGIVLRAGASRPNASAPDDIVTLADGRVFRIRGVPLMLGDAMIGSLELGTSLDNAFATELQELARTHTMILIDGKVHASTLPAAITAEAARKIVELPVTAGTVDLGGESWAVQRVGGVGRAAFLALESVEALASARTRTALLSVAGIAALSLLFAAAASMWLARALTGPIDRLSASLTEMTRARKFDTPVPAPGSSRELDALARTFNALMRSLVEAQAETQAAYLGAIRALAAALDARDPYTAGHSERVSALSVEMGRALEMSEQEISILRLGALLHDIGKIGVPDEILRKTSALSPSEFELIRAHPVIGARILRSIQFLSEHLPIVELHHERPDGHGYPYGLVGDAIPLHARIVHVADAFDAMTTARAYRPGRLPHEAIAELRRCAGTDFDPPSVDALVVAVPRLPAAFAGFDSSAFQLAAMRRTQAS